MNRKLKLYAVEHLDFTVDDDGLLVTDYIPGRTPEEAMKVLKRTHKRNAVMPTNVREVKVSGYRISLEKVVLK